jgi:hypothetical protein
MHWVYLLFQGIKPCSFIFRFLSSVLISFPLFFFFCYQFPYCGSKLNNLVLNNLLLECCAITRVSRPTSIFFVAPYRKSKNSSPSPREPGRSYSDECSVVAAWVLGCSVCNGCCVVNVMIALLAVTNSNNNFFLYFTVLPSSLHHHLCM